jgi:EAL domain-containing protein (putative c-di-GMP-specific phosphodiesterase class I)
VAELAGAGSDVTVVRSIVQLGHALGMEVVAEGVDTAAQACALADVGCDLVQGRWSTGPVTAGDIEHLLARAER